MTALLLLLSFGLAPRPRRVRRGRGLHVTVWILRSVAGLAVAALAFERGGHRAAIGYFERGAHLP